MRRKTSKYCSAECQHKGLIKHDYSPRICPVCGIKFTPCRDCKGIYCSNHCRGIAQHNEALEIQEKKQHIKQLAKQLRKELNKLYERKKELDYKEQHIKQCRECGSNYIQHYNNYYCSDKCKRKYNNRIKWQLKEQRIYKNSTPDLSITLNKLYKRDNGVCALCGKHCNYEDYTYVDNTFIAGNYYPSIDHVVPIAKGGKHEWNNVQLAHRICNTLKRCKPLM